MYPPEFHREPRPPQTPLWFMILLSILVAGLVLAGVVSWISIIAEEIGEWLE